MQFYITPPHNCGYLPQRQAVNVFADPFAAMNMPMYGRLIHLGFRRSGRHVYRPHCPDCHACVATRVPVAGFCPDRSQRRNRAQNADLEVVIRGTEYREEHFELYRRYVNLRHAGGEMENPTPDSYAAFLRANWADTWFVEFRAAGALLCVAVVDRIEDGLSAVYTYYDPDQPRRGLGVHAVLWQIEHARQLGLPYVYLGYWIAGHAKMGYKQRYRPIEAFQNGRWQTLATPPDI